MQSAETTLAEKPLRVLLLASCFPHPGNPLLGVWALSQAESLHRAGVDIRVVSPTSLVPPFFGALGIAPWAAHCPLEARMGAVRVAYPRWPVYHTGLIRRITRRHPSLALALGWRFVRDLLLTEVRNHRPDVILAHHTFEGGELARRLKLETGLNYVTADWDFDEITDCKRFRSRQGLYARVLDGASSVIATSERMKKDLVAQFPGVRAVVAHYGRDPLPPQMLQAPRPLDRGGKLIVFCAASFYERKGLPVLIEAFSKVENDHANAELWIAGGGHDQGLVQRALQDSGARRVRMLGPLPHHQLLQEMVWADVFALVGWDEPFATVYVEALAAGKPIICCNDGGICDVVRDGVEAVLVPPRNVEATAQALRRLLIDQSLRERMSAASAALFNSQLTTAAYARTILSELGRAARGEGNAE